MTLTQTIGDWLSQFPGLSGGVMHLDFLPPEARSYSVCSVPTEPVLRQYLDGSSRRQLLFAVSSREFFGPDILRQAESLKFFEELEAWLEFQNQKKQLPALGEMRHCVSVELLSTAYPFSVSPDGMAQYQVQMKMTYLQEGML